MKINGFNGTLVGVLGGVLVLVAGVPAMAQNGPGWGWNSTVAVQPLTAAET